MKNLSLYTLFFIFLSCSNGEINKETPASNPYYVQAFKYRNKGKTDSAFFYFNQSKDLFLENQDRLGAGKCLINMAIILTDKGDYFGGQETSLEAIQYLDHDNQEHHYYLGTNFNNLGIATYQLKDYERAINFYDSAIRFSSDSLDTRIYLNNKAKAYHDNKEYAKALKIYDQIIKKTSKNQREYARSLTNISDTRWRQNSAYNAAPDLLTALHIRENEQDLLGLNSSYAHLAEYYAPKRADSALFYAYRRYATAKKLKSATDQINALEMLIKLSPIDSAKGYFETYRQLSDSVQQARNTAKNQFALIRYEAEKNKADNLRLQKENAEKAYQISRQRMLILLVILAAGGLVIFGVFWYKKRKQRLELEALNRIKAHQLQTSKKIHDVVANGLYRVMTEIENQRHIDREGILDRLENMYEKSRDISYETEALPPTQQVFNERIADLLTSFATDSTKVLIAGNEPEVWHGVHEQARHEIEHILQELMVNMRKHSRASHVVVRFEQLDQQLSMHYSDDGVGLPEASAWRNGLTNTGNRIKSLRGVITFDNEAEKGLRIQIAFPVS